jgi:hypothetical protein
MIVFDGTYRLPLPRGRGRRLPRKAWELSCDLKVIDMEMAQPGIRHLKRYVVIATETTETPMKTSAAETLGKRIFRDFQLTRENVLWLESRVPGRLEAAIFTPIPSLDEETHYQISWRPALENELKLIESFLVR